MQYPYLLTITNLATRYQWTEGFPTQGGRRNRVDWLADRGNYRWTPTDRKGKQEL